VQTAVDVIRQAGNDQIVLLHCVSNYPAAPADCNLRAMGTMAEAFGLPVGFSDHTLGIEVALAAVALGAAVIEKHFTLDRALPGPDHKASLPPAELGELVRAIRAVESALGDGRKVPRPSEASTAAVARRSLVAAETIPAGTVLQEHMIAVRRPGSGLSPAQKPRLVGRTARETIPSGALFSWSQLK
jgi:sialic acid synthase SpsE